jgi:hypothetical protein
MNLGIL